MREIKFRAWDKKRGRFHWGNSNVCLTLSGRLMWQFGEQSPDLLSLDELPNYVLQQYTGLKDKNGTEVYEGDIIGMINPTSKGGCWEVVWHDFAWQVLLRNFPDIPNYYVRCGKHLECDEVIGNIWDNPELLEVKDTL